MLIRDFFRPRHDPISSVPTFVALDKVLDGALPSESELKLLGAVFGDEMVRSLLSKRGILPKAFEEVAAGFSLWRSFITGGEQSVLLRQAAIPAFQPLNLPITARAVGRSLKGGFFAKAAEEIDAVIAEIAELAALIHAPRQDFERGPYAECQTAGTGGQCEYLHMCPLARYS